MNNIKVSIIVPIYGVEKFIERCARSLFNQTLEECEFIFVNDCTKDKSIDVLKRVVAEYPQLNEYITILHHEHNKGLAASRNTGLRVAKGKYIMNCDSDDYVEPIMAAELYVKAEEGNDIVWCDFYTTTTQGDSLSKQQGEEKPIRCISNIMRGRIHGSVCNKFAKRSLYNDNDIWFPEGNNVLEDLCTTIKLFACAERVAYLPKAYYHYVQYNAGAYTKEVSVERCMQQIRNTQTVESYLQQKGIFDNVSCDINNLKLNAKFMLLYSTKAENFKLWRNTFPEANAYIKEHRVGWRLKLLEYAADKKIDIVPIMNQLARNIAHSFR